MELIGKGPDQKGIVWVAARVPDGMITAHANLSRITTFPLDDPENWLYSPDVICFAIEKNSIPRVPDRNRSVIVMPTIPVSAPCRSGPARAASGASTAAPRQVRRGSPTPFSGEKKGLRTTRSSSSPMCLCGVADADGLDARPLRRDAVRYDEGAYWPPVWHPVPLPTRIYRSRSMGRLNMWERPISTQQAGSSP